MDKAFLDLIDVPVTKENLAEVSEYWRSALSGIAAFIGKGDPLDITARDLLGFLATTGDAKENKA